MSWPASRNEEQIRLGQRLVELSFADKANRAWQCELNEGWGVKIIGSNNNNNNNNNSNNSSNNSNNSNLQNIEEVIPN